MKLVVTANDNSYESYNSRKHATSASSQYVTAWHLLHELSSSHTSHPGRQGEHVAPSRNVPSRQFVHMSKPSSHDKQELSVQPRQ